MAAENRHSWNLLLNVVALIPRVAIAIIIAKHLKTDQSWLKLYDYHGCRVLRRGFFFRAESFFNFASYIETVSDLRAYGGKSLHQQSHGESFLALFENRFEQGFYILDEPEAALSPQRQLTFMSIIHQLEQPGHAQFLIATHSPILMAYPGAKIICFDDNEMKEANYKDTEHYQLTKGFLDTPERYFRWLFDGDLKES